MTSAVLLALALAGSAQAQGPAPAAATPPAAPATTATTTTTTTAPAPPAPIDLGPPIKATSPACGISYMPLVRNAGWVYRQVGGSDLVKLRVTDIGPGKDEAGHAVTAITVEETYKDSTTILVWTCTSAGLRIPLDSFMWGGEPGDVLGVTLKITDHKDYWMHPDSDVTPGSGWAELIKADAERADASGKGVKHPPVKLELEHHFKAEEAEDVDTIAGSFHTLRFTYEMRGRAFIGTEKAEVPAAAEPGHFWFVKGIGPVKIEDNLNLRQRRTWELAGTNLAH
jgi:hypothetical protein